ncbi:histone-fold-containing protein [Kockiozyma suomiensis]|uniref:histone-fold-containing protein n=1 Tax=Kockiozyma suomiensis TaxID=1337062 RepID=UPI003343EE34
MSLSPKPSSHDDTDDNIANILDMLETETQSAHGNPIHMRHPGNGGNPNSHNNLLGNEGSGRDEGPSHAGLDMMEAMEGELDEDAGGVFNGDYEVKEQDKWLPIANVARIMKMALPDNAKISKEAKECMQECVSEFISFITSEASEKCSAEKRKTVNGEDILFAMTSLGFENYSETLKIYLAKYRQFIATRAGAK